MYYVIVKIIDRYIDKQIYGYNASANYMFHGSIYLFYHIINTLTAKYIFVVFTPGAK